MKNIENINVIKIMFINPDYLSGFNSYKAGHDFRYSLDTKKIRGLGWAPRYKFEDAMKETIRWYKENEWWWESAYE